MFSSRTRSLVKQTLQRQAKLFSAVTRTGNQGNYSVIATALARTGSQSHQNGARSAFTVSNRFFSAGKEVTTDSDDYEDLSDETEYDSEEYTSEYTSDEYESSDDSAGEFEEVRASGQPKQIPSIDDEAGVIYKSVFPYRQEWERYDGELNLNRTYSRFDQPVVNDTYSHGMTGSYVLVSDEELALLPEGLAGEMNEEFQMPVLDERKRWMIRDSGKLLCQLLDQHKGRSAPGQKANRHKYDHVEFPGLTDRPEWIDAIMRVDCYGETVLDVPKNSKKASGVRSVAPVGDTDVVSIVMDGIRDVAPKVSDGALPKQVLLTGPRGVGKSVALNQAVLHARRSGWLVLFIPDGWGQAQKGSYVQPALLEKTAQRNAGNSLSFKVAAHVTNEDELAELPPVAPEQTAEDTVFDNHEMSAEALRGFLRAHAAQLRTVPLRNRAVMDKYRHYLEDFTEAFDRIKSVEREWQTMPFVQLRKSIEGEDNVPEMDELDADVLRDFKFHEYECKTLEDLALLGVALRDLSGSLFIDLIAELRELDDPSMPVLIAVDQYNTWEVNSAYAYNGRSIPAKQLCVPYALNFLSPKKADAANWTMKNGFCIAATSLRPPEARRITYVQNKPSIPLSITVPHYSASEFLAAASYLTCQGHLTSKLELRDLLSLRMYTGSNPRLLREQSVSYLLPRMMELGYEDALKYAVQKQREDAESMLAERARKEASWDGEGEPPFDADDIEGFAMEDDEDAGYFDEVMSDGEVKLGKGSLEALAADKAKRAKKSGKKKGRK